MTLRDTAQTRGGHKIQPSRKMSEDFLRWTISFTEVVKINCLAKCIYGGEHVIYGDGHGYPPRKIDLWRQFLKSIYGDGSFKTFASQNGGQPPKWPTNVKVSKPQPKPISNFLLGLYEYEHLGFPQPLSLSLSPSRLSPSPSRSGACYCAPPSPRVVPPSPPMQATVPLHLPLVHMAGW
jgi:hypothetical protein